MKRFSRVLPFLLAAALLVATSGCSMLKRSYKVVKVEDSEAFLSAGRAEGATLGQEYKVYRLTAVQPQGNRQPPVFRRDLAGTVQITELGDHSSKARVLQGEVRVNDIARGKPQVQIDSH